MFFYSPSKNISLLFNFCAGRDGSLQTLVGARLCCEYRVPSDGELCRDFNEDNGELSTRTADDAGDFGKIPLFLARSGWV